MVHCFNSYFAFAFLFVVIYDHNCTQWSCKFLLDHSAQSRKETYTEDINRCTMFDIRWLISATIFLTKTNEKLSSHYSNHLKAVDTYLEQAHSAWSIRTWSYSGPYFPAFELNTGKYGPEITLYLDTFNVV